jgi:hypothetical protein
MSVGPGAKPVTPALPLAPNKLKLFALMVAGAPTQEVGDGTGQLLLFSTSGATIA